MLRRRCSTNRSSGARSSRDQLVEPDVTNAPVDSRSAALVDFISGRTPTNTTAVRHLHPDFGPPPYGFPTSSLSIAISLACRWRLWRMEARATPVRRGCRAIRFPDEARTPGALHRRRCHHGGTSGDRHMLMIDRDRWFLYETFATRWNLTAGRWEAGSGASFDLNRSDAVPKDGRNRRRGRAGDLPGLIPIRRGVRHRRSHTPA
jgi:hypothetical protein